MVTLVTGGARSGKSSFAESLYKKKKDIVYIATSKIEDAEMKERVKMHREGRDEDWRTFEGTYNLDRALGEEENYLLDCLTVLTSNIMFDLTKDLDYIDSKAQRQVEDKILEEVRALIDKIREKGYDLILVTNEVGYSTVPEHHITRAFRDIQGRINQRLAGLSDNVYLVCCGIPVKIK